MICANFQIITVLPVSLLVVDILVSLHIERLAAIATWCLFALVSQFGGSDVYAVNAWAVQDLVLCVCVCDNGSSATDINVCPFAQSPQFSTTAVEAH